MDISKKNNFMARKQIILQYNSYPNHPMLMNEIRQ